jgi:hypothetical protein
MRLLHANRRSPRIKCEAGFRGKRYPAPIEFDENRLRFAKPIFFIPNFRHGP